MTASQLLDEYTLTAAGLRSEQLPEVSRLTTLTGVRVHPDRGQSEQVATRGNAIGTYSLCNGLLCLPRAG